MYADGPVPIGVASAYGTSTTAKTLVSLTSGNQKRTVRIWMPPEPTCPGAWVARVAAATIAAISIAPPSRRGSPWASDARGVTSRRLPAQRDGVEADVADGAHLAQRVIEAELEAALGREPDAAAVGQAGRLVGARLHVGAAIAVGETGVAVAQRRVVAVRAAQRDTKARATDVVGSELGTTAERAAVGPHLIEFAHQRELGVLGRHDIIGQRHPEDGRQAEIASQVPRSEERRVGKECRSRW